MLRRCTWLITALILIFGLLVGSCAPAPKTEPVPTPKPPKPTPAPAPYPSLPEDRAIGRMVTEQDEAKDSDTWASYLKGESITAIAIGQDCLWLGTDSGLIRFSKRGEEITLTSYDEGDGLPGVDIQALNFYGGERLDRDSRWWTVQIRWKPVH